MKIFIKCKAVQTSDLSFWAGIFFVNASHMNRGQNLERDIQVSASFIMRYSLVKPILSVALLCTNRVKQRICIVEKISNL